MKPQLSDQFVLTLMIVLVLILTLVGGVLAQSKDVVLGAIIMLGLIGMLLGRES